MRLQTSVWRWWRAVPAPCFGGNEPVANPMVMARVSCCVLRVGEDSTIRMRMILPS